MFRLLDPRSASGLLDLGTSTNEDWREQLVHRHPELFGDPAGGMSALPECGDGWADLVNRAVERISQASAAGRSPVRIVQIKEKYGTLRVYTETIEDAATAAAVKEAISLAKARSACTCELCGAEGRLRERGGVFATACDEHAKGKAVEVRPGWENVHITRALRDGRVRIISCRRYDRVADAFVEVPPLALGIKE
jgi:hypothetical protein